MTPDEDNIYVCRCEEVTVGDIKRAIKAGARSFRDIKVRTNAGMGVCQGITCRKNIEKILREQNIDFDPSCGQQRFPVRLLKISDFVSDSERGEDEIWP